MDTYPTQELEMLLQNAKSELSSAEINLFSEGLKNNQETNELVRKIFSHFKSCGDIGFVGLGSILALLGTPGSIIAANFINFTAYLWQRENQNKALRKLADQMETKKNADPAIVTEDEFIELFTQFMDISAKSAVEEKRNYLVNLFLNSVSSSEIPFGHKNILFRIYSQISLEEIQVLKNIYDLEQEIIKDQTFPSVSVDDLVKKLNWERKNVFITCEALAQLLLISDAHTGFMNHSEYQHETWRLTVLGYRFLHWSTNDIAANK